MTPAELDRIRIWLVRSGGLSSYTIVWVLVPKLREFTEALSGNSIGNCPLDADDFYRCRRVLELIRDGATRLSEVAAAFPHSRWAKLVPIWPELEALAISSSRYSALRLDSLLDC